MTSESLHIMIGPYRIGDGLTRRLWGRLASLTSHVWIRCRKKYYGEIPVASCISFISTVPLSRHQLGKETLHCASSQRRQLT